MEKQEIKKGTIVKATTGLVIGIGTMVTAVTVFKDNDTVKQFGLAIGLVVSLSCLIPLVRENI